MFFLRIRIWFSASMAGDSKLPVVLVLKGLAPSSGLHRHLHTHITNHLLFVFFFFKEALVHFATD